MTRNLQFCEDGEALPIPRDARDDNNKGALSIGSSKENLGLRNDVRGQPRPQDNGACRMRDVHLDCAAL